MNCLICHTDISAPVDQFGDTRCPICCSCWLAGLDEVQGDADLVFELQHGATLKEAEAAVNAKHCAELSNVIAELESDDDD